MLLPTAALVFLALFAPPAAPAADPVALTTDGTYKTDPVFIKGGAEVVYTVQASPTQFRLMRLKLGETKATPLHPDAETSEFEPTYTADAAWYAFVQSRGNLNLKLIMREAATGKEEMFNPGGGFAAIRRPTFHPKGERVAFGFPSASGQDLATVDRAGRDRKTLTSGGINNWPAWSPDGKRLAFCSSRDGDLDLYTIDADGSNLRRVLKLPGMQMRPAWSPDGKRLAFTSNHEGNYDVWVVNADGTGLARVTNNPERDDYSAWHPDGARIVLVGERKGAYELYLAPAPGAKVE